MFQTLVSLLLNYDSMDQVACMRQTNEIHRTMQGEGRPGKYAKTA